MICELPVTLHLALFEAPAQIQSEILNLALPIKRSCFHLFLRPTPVRPLRCASFLRTSRAEYFTSAVVRSAWCGHC
jgi:hypothetical protein